jgi:hypothetical protein
MKDFHVAFKVGLCCQRTPQKVFQTFKSLSNYSLKKINPKLNAAL